MADHRLIRNLSLEELKKGVLSTASGGGDLHWSYVAALQMSGSEEVLGQALRWCRSQDLLERRVGADILGQLGGSGCRSPYRSISIPVLVGMLKDPSPCVLSSVLVALGHLELRGDLDPLLMHLEHPSKDVRFGLVFALLGNEAQAAIDCLIVLSGDPEEEVRSWATFALGSQVEHDSPMVRQALLDRIDDEHDETRNEALLGLALRNDGRVLPRLIEELGSECVGKLTIEAASALADPELLPALRRLVGQREMDENLLEEAIRRCST